MQKTSWKNKFLLGLVNSISREKTPSPSLNHILIVATTALGDTLWATPALVNLRQTFSSAKLTVLTSPIGSQVLQHHPSIDQLLVLKEPVLLQSGALLRQFKRERFDAALFFHASQRLVLPLAALSGIPCLIGTAGQQKGLDGLLTDCIEATEEHEIERRLKIAERLGAKRFTEMLSYFVQQEEREEMERTLASYPKPWIAFHPGSKEPFRRYPISLFAQVGKTLQEERKGTLFLTGTSSEQPLLSELQHRLPFAKMAPVQPSARHLAAFLEQMDLLLSNDTGPFHLAIAVGCPAVGLYVSTNPALCGPYRAPRAIALSKQPTCMPCIKRRCQEPFCFLQITPKEVVDACRALLI